MSRTSPYMKGHSSGKTPKTTSLLAFLTRLILLCILPLLVLAVYLAFNHVQTLQSQRVAEANDRVRNVATAIDRQVGAQIAALQVLAASPLLDDPSRISQFYNESKAFRESFGGHVILADLSMQMLSNTRVPFGEPLPRLPRPRGHAAAPAVVETGKPSVGDMFFGPIAKEPLVAVVVPVARDGHMKFLLLSIVETRQFQQRLDDVSLPAEWSLTLLDGKDEVMARRSSAAIQDRPRDEKSHRRFVAKSGVSHWLVVLAVPGSVYNAPIMSATIALIIVILGATLVSILGGRLASMRLAKSVASLAEPPSQQSTREVVEEIEAVRQKLIDAAEARNAAESAHLESEEKYRLIVESMQDVVYQTDMEGLVIFASPSVESLLGFTPDEVLGRRLSERYAFPEDRTRFLRLLAESGSVSQYEAQLTRKDGSRVWVSTSARLIKDQTGTPIGVEGVTRDISSRKEAEEFLRVSEERFRLAFENANIGVCLVDPQGRLLKVNDQMCEMMGYSRSEMEAMTVNDIAHPEDTGLSPRFIKRVSSGELDRGEFEKRYIHKQGHVVWGRVASTLVRDRQGDPLYFVSHVQDLTERRHAEEAIRKSEKRYRSLFENMLEAFAYCRMLFQDDKPHDFVFLDVNDSFGRLTGLENVIGRKVSEVVPGIGDSNPEILEIYGRVALTGNPEKFETYVSPMGIWFSISVYSTEKERFVAVFDNVTDRKRAEEALRVSEEKFSGASCRIRPACE